MVTKKIITGVDVMSWLKAQAGFMPLFVLLGFLAWSWAEPKVKKVVKLEIAPLDIRVNKMDTIVTEMRFAQKQQLYLIKKMVGEQAVKEMELELETFRPYKRK